MSQSVNPGPLPAGTGTSLSAICHFSQYSGSARAMWSDLDTGNISQAAEFINELKM